MEKDYLIQEKLMKKLIHRIFGHKKIKENQQIKADSKNRISQMGRNMSQGASNFFHSLRCHSAWGNLTRRGSGTKRGHSQPGQNARKKHGHY